MFSVGRIVVIKRSGKDGTCFCMNQKNCLIGKHIDSDIRVQLDTVSMKHACIEVQQDGKCCLISLSQTNPVEVNGRPLQGAEKCVLKHRDLIIVGDRCLRWEYPDTSDGAAAGPAYVFATPTKFTGTQTPKAASARKRKMSNTSFESSASKRKRVSFGPYLSPEHFDRQLPSSTPLRKGDKPTFSTPTVVGSPRLQVTPVQKPCDSKALQNGTPTKSLLRRRSPTPIKPYLARTLGFVASSTGNLSKARTPHKLSSSPSKTPQSSKKVTSSFSAKFSSPVKLKTTSPKKPKSPSHGRPKSLSPGRKNSLSSDRPNSPSTSRPKSLSPGKSKSLLLSRSKSSLPGKIKSSSPGRPKSPSPGRAKSSSPSRPKSLAPDRPKSLSPGRSKSLSPGRPESSSPGGPKYSSTGRPESPSPGKPKSTSPGRSKSTSPGRSKSPSHGRSKSSSPGKPKSSSPGRPKSSSPGRPKSPSPDRPKSSSPGRPKSSSPGRPKSPSPVIPKSSSPDRPKSHSPSPGRPKSRFCTPKLPFSGRSKSPSSGRAIFQSESKSSSLGRPKSPTHGTLKSPSPGRPKSLSTGRSNSHSPDRLMNTSTGKSKFTSVRRLKSSYAVNPKSLSARTHKFPSSGKPKSSLFALSKSTPTANSVRTLKLTKSKTPDIMSKMAKQKSNTKKIRSRSLGNYLAPRSAEMFKESDILGNVSQNLKIYPKRKSLQSSLKPSFQESPQFLQKKTPRSSTKKIPQSSLKKTPQSLKKGSRSSLKESPRSSLKKSPCSSLKKSPRSSLKKSPGSFLKKSPGSSLKKTPHTSLKKASPHSSLKKTSPHSSLKKASPHSPLRKASPHSSLKKASPHSSLKKASPHSSLKKASPHSSLKKASPHSPLKKASPHSPLRKASPHSSLKKASPHSSLKKASPHSSLKKASPHSSLKKASPHSSLKKASPHSSLKKASSHSSLKKASPHSLLRKASPHSPLKKTPRSSVKKVPKTSTLFTKKTPKLLSSNKAHSSKAILNSRTSSTSYNKSYSQKKSVQKAIIDSKTRPVWGRSSFASVVKRNIRVDKPANAVAQRALRVVARAKQYRARNNKVRLAGNAFGTVSDRNLVEMAQPNFNFGINSTGHVDSPAPIIIFKKSASTIQPLYRKGRKSLQKDFVTAIKEAVNLSGIEALMTSPNSSQVDLSSGSRSEALGYNTKLFTDSLAKSKNLSVTSPRQYPRYANSLCETAKASSRSLVGNPKSSVATTLPAANSVQLRNSSVKSPIQSQESLGRSLIDSPKSTSKSKDCTPYTSKSSPRLSTPTKSTSKSPSLGVTTVFSAPLDSSRSPRSLSKSVATPTSHVEASSLRVPVSCNVSTSQNSSKQSAREKRLSSPVCISSEESTTRLGNFLSRKSLGVLESELVESNNRRTRSLGVEAFEVDASGKKLMQKILSPLQGLSKETPNLNKSLSRSVVDNSRISKSNAVSPFSRNSSSLDFTAVATPNITRDRFISPLGTPKYAQPDSMLLNSVSTRREPITPDRFPPLPEPANNSDVAINSNKNRSRHGQTPSADYRTVQGMKELFITPNSPKVDYRNVQGVKNLLRAVHSPKNNLLDVSGVKALMQNRSPLANYTNVENIKRLFSTNRRVSLSDSTLETLSLLVKSPVSPEQPLEIHEILNVVPSNLSPTKVQTPVKGSPHIQTVAVHNTSTKKVLGTMDKQSPRPEPYLVDLELEAEELENKVKAKRTRRGGTATAAKTATLTRGAKRGARETLTQEPEVRATRGKRPVPDAEGADSAKKAKLSFDSPVNENTIQSSVPLKSRSPHSSQEKSATLQVTSVKSSKQSGSRQSKPALRKTRGRLAKAKEVPLLIDDGCEVVESHKITRRGRLAKSTESSPAAKMAPVAHRERKATVAAPPQEESDTSPEISSVNSKLASPKRTRRGRIAAGQKSTTPVKSTRRARVSKTSTCVSISETPVVTEQVEPTPQMVIPAKTTPPKRVTRGRQAKVAVPPKKIASPSQNVNVTSPKTVTPIKKVSTPTVSPVGKKAPVRSLPVQRNTRGKAAKIREEKSGASVRAPATSPVKETTRGRKALKPASPEKSPALVTRQTRSRAKK